MFDTDYTIDELIAKLEDLYNEACAAERAYENYKKGVKEVKIKAAEFIDIDNITPPYPFVVLREVKKSCKSALETARKIANSQQ